MAYASAASAVGGAAGRSTRRELEERVVNAFGKVYAVSAKGEARQLRSDTSVVHGEKSWAAVCTQGPRWKEPTRSSTANAAIYRVPLQRETKSDGANGVHRLGKRPGARTTAERGLGGSIREEKEEGPQGKRETERTATGMEE